MRVRSKRSTEDKQHGPSSVKLGEIQLSYVEECFVNTEATPLKKLSLNNNSRNYSPAYEKV